MFIRTFGCYIMESAEAKALREEAMKIEGSLESSRNTMKLGADLPDKGIRHPPCSLHSFGPNSDCSALRLHGDV